LIGYGLWLTVFDLARRNLRKPGLSRFVALCLLIGYAWLVIAGLLGLMGGVVTPGLRYDATLHAVFLGFVISMIFGHAPIIFPAVLRLPVGFSPFFYAHLVLLHGSLAVRILADIGGWVQARQWAGAVNAVVIVAYLANLALTARPGAGANRTPVADTRAG